MEQMNPGNDLFVSDQNDHPNKFFVSAAEDGRRTTEEVVAARRSVPGRREEGQDYLLGVRKPLSHDRADH